MEIYFPLSGDVGALQFPLVLVNIHNKSISGTCEVVAEGVCKKIAVENGKIIFATSNQEEDSLREFMLRKKIIDEGSAKKASGYMKKKNVRFGKALVELGLLGYDSLWESVRDQLKHIVFSLFYIQNGRYQIYTDPIENRENIILDCNILDIIVEGIRAFSDEKVICQQLKNVHEVYLNKSESVQRLAFRPYELHILDLVEKNAGVKDIIQKSELLRYDTLRVLYLMLILEIISIERVERKVRRGLGGHDHSSASASEDKGIVPISTFASFEEALGYFNSKYELIYKVLSKEIGPIALSILSKAIEDISEKLPFFLKKFSLGPDGSVRKTPVLKSVWYHDFDQNIGEFVHGLEEILYAEIYAVKKHLGIEFEQQILKWIN
jgi:hypothetical protein